MDTGKILLMRHAEKPEDPLDPDLSAPGETRAQNLARYISDNFGKPDFLFASALSKHSQRPYETLKPLSEAIGVPIDPTFADQDYAALAHEIHNKPKYERKLLVVCWHHGHIPSLAQDLKAKAGDYPNPWDPAVFNLILEFTFANGTPAVRRVIEPF